MENGNDPSTDSEFLGLKYYCRFFLQFLEGFSLGFFLVQASFSIQFLLGSK